MDTSRLRKLQQEPSHVQRLLEALVTHSDLVPAGAYQIRDPASVPKELRNIATQATKQGRVWACWAYTFRTWMITGEMPLSASRERGTPVLQVDVHTDEGWKDSGFWMPGRDGGWTRCND